MEIHKKIDLIEPRCGYTDFLCRELWQATRTWYKGLFGQYKVKFAAGILQNADWYYTIYMVFSVTYTISEGPKLDA